MERILVTGATGFIGTHLCPRLSDAGFEVVGAVRRTGSTRTGGITFINVGEIGPDTDWSAALQKVSVVVHLAAHCHHSGESTEDASRCSGMVNLHGTMQLAEQAAQAGVKRLVFLSTVKVNGEMSGSNPFSEEDAPNPVGPYALSKWQGESGLAEISAGSSLEIVVIRPPLVYGPGVRANFLSLLRAVDKGIPLPLANIKNKRSLVGVRNLADMITCCATHPAAAGRVFFVSDGEDVSTPDLVRAVAAALHRTVRMIPFPPWLLRGVAALLGKAEIYDRLCQSLTVSTTKARDLLQWVPAHSLQEELSRTAEWYIKNFR